MRKVTVTAIGTTKDLFDKRRRSGTCHTVEVELDSEGPGCRADELVKMVEAAAYGAWYDPSVDRIDGVFVRYENGDEFYYTKADVACLCYVDMDAYERYMREKEPTRNAFGTTLREWRR